MRRENAMNVRDVMMIAAMLVLTMVVNSLVGLVMSPVPVLYLYVAAAVEMFISATFYLVAANRVNKHGLLLFWCSVQGIVYGLAGFLFLIPYFVLLGVVCELAMIGPGTYRKPMRNAFGWGILSVGMVLGNAVPLWFTWESFKQTAQTNAGFSEELLDMQVALMTTPWLMVVACLVTLVGGTLGVAFGHRILRRHFRRAGILD